MTAVYTLAHSCLSDSVASSSPLSVSPSSLSRDSHTSGSLARRSSLSNGHHNYHTYSHHHNSSSALPLSYSSSNNNNSTNFQSPVLSVSPPKQRANTASSFSPSSLGSNGKSGLSNLLQHHARPATAVPLASVPVSVSVPAPVSAAPALPTAQAAAMPVKIQAPAPAPLPYIHSCSVIDTFKQVLSEVDIDSCDAAGENAFLVCDLARVYAQYQLWQSELGSRIEAFFAVKCNPDPLIIKLMVNLGIGFDCASHQEISNVLQEGAKNDKIIYANPCKASSFIRHAYKKGVEMMTFDNSDELEKVVKFHPSAKMVLRILTDDSGSLCKLGLKFGAPLSEVRSLLIKAKELKVDVIGISFHVGSGCTNPLLFGDAVSRAKWAFEVGTSLGFNFTLLDVGGGFGGDNFREIAGILREAVETHFPKEEGVRVIAEPGRYFVSEAFEMATNIIARRGKGQLSSSSSEYEDEDEEMEGFGDSAGGGQEEESMVMYYINDGVYGAFNCTMFDHQVVHPKVLTSQGTFVSSPSTYFTNSNSSSSSSLVEVQEEACSIWGPTCDSIDCVSSKSYLPVSKIKVGDWLRWENMGAYTICAASQFNGFKKSRVVYTIDAKDQDTENRIRELLVGPSSSSSSSSTIILQ